MPPFFSVACLAVVLSTAVSADKVYVTDDNDVDPSIQSLYEIDTVTQTVTNVANCEFPPESRCPWDALLLIVSFVCCSHVVLSFSTIRDIGCDGALAFRLRCNRVWLQLLWPVGW